MTVPESILSRLSNLREPLDLVQSAISSIYALGDGERQDLDHRIAVLEEAVDNWLDRTGDIEFGPEGALVGFVPPIDDLIDRLDDYLDRVAESDSGDDVENALRALRESNALRADGTAADALGRLCGLSLLHIAIACDVGSLSDLDELIPWDQPGGTLSLPSAPPLTIYDAAYIARLLETLGSDLASLTASEHMHDSGHEYPESQAMDKILDRATDGTKAILVGAAPGGVLFSHIKPALTAAATSGPADLREAVGIAAGRIARIVGKLLKRVGEVIDRVVSSYSSTISRFISKWVENKKDHLVDGAIRTVLGWVFGIQSLERRIDAAYKGGGQSLTRKQRDVALNDLLKKISGGSVP